MCPQHDTMWMFLDHDCLYNIIHPNQAIRKPLAWSEACLCGIHPSCACWDKVLFKELPFPTLFFQDWPMTKNTIHSWLLPLPFSPLTAGLQAVRAEMSLFFGSLLSFYLHHSCGGSSHLQRCQGYQSTSSSSLPHLFLSMLSRINSTEQINFPIDPCCGCFWALERKSNWTCCHLHWVGALEWTHSISTYSICTTHLHTGCLIWLQQHLYMTAFKILVLSLVQRWVLCKREREVSSGVAVRRQSFDNNFAGETI